MFEDFERSAKRFRNPSEEVWKLFTQARMPLPLRKAYAHRLPAMRLSVTYREGRTWVMARPDSKRMPRGVCLQRREAAHRDVQAFCEALEKGNPRNVG